MAETVIAPSGGSGGGGGGAPADAEYLTSSANGTLSAERVATDTATVAWDFTTAAQAKANVPNDAITYAKLQNTTAGSILLGRGASGAGDPQEITLGTNLSMSGTTLNASGGGGSSDTIAVVSADVVHATNSTTLSDITGLTFSTTASASEQWLVDITLLTNVNASGGTSADWKFGWTVSGAQTIRWGGIPESGNATSGVQPVSGTQATALNYGGAAVDGIIVLRALVFGGGSAGAIQLQFAQVSLIASAVLTIRKGSVLIARKVVV